MVDCLSDPKFLTRMTNIEFANVSLRSGFIPNNVGDFSSYLFGLGSSGNLEDINNLKNKFMREYTADDFARLVKLF